MNYNPELMALAEWRLTELRKQAAEKEGFVPPVGGGDPAAAAAAGGGAPPVDPMAGGGAPPMDPAMMGGGAPPMSPAMMGGGAPPMDPAMMGGGMPPPPPMGGPAPIPGGGGLDPSSLTQMITQAVQQAMGTGAVAGGGVPGAPGKPAKPDLNVIAMDVFQCKKLIVAMFNAMGLPLPPDILDGPNRDPSTGAPMPLGAPGSTSDPQHMMAQAQQQQGPGGGQVPGSAIPLVQPMAPAGPGAAMAGSGAADGGATKVSHDEGLEVGRGHRGFDPRTVSRAAALAAICKQISNR